MIRVLNINQAIKILSEAEITDNKEVLRRWLRQNKIKDAFITTKHSGWQIPEKSLKEFIATRKKNSSIKSEDWTAGYNQAKKECREKLKQLALNGMFEKQFYIKRSEFGELAGRRTTSHKKEFLQFCDERVFKFQVTHPRQNITCLYLDPFFKYENVAIFIDADKYPNVFDEQQAIEYNAIDLLIAYLKSEFHKWTEERIEKAVALFKDGFSDKEIEEKTGIKQAVFQRYRMKNNIF